MYLLILLILADWGLVVKNNTQIWLPCEIGHGTEWNPVVLDEQGSVGATEYRDYTKALFPGP